METRKRDPCDSGDDTTNSTTNRSNRADRQRIPGVNGILGETAINNQPQPPTLEIRKSSHTKQGHRMPAGVCWKMLLFMRASVLTYLGLVMEYPGLDESE